MHSRGSIRYGRNGVTFYYARPNPIDNKVVFEFPDEGVGGLYTLRMLFLIAKFHLDRRELTLNSQLLNDMIAALNNSLSENIESSQSQKEALKKRIDEPGNIDSQLEEITSFLLENRMISPSESTIEEISVVLKDAAYPFSIDEKALSNLIEKVTTRSDR